MSRDPTLGTYSRRFHREVKLCSSSRIIDYRFLSVNDPTTTLGMQHLFDKYFGNGKAKGSHQSDVPPPQWTPADEEPHEHGKYTEATFDEYEEAERFCALYPVERPKLLPSDTTVRLSQEGCRLWGMRSPDSSRFKGRVEHGAEVLAGVTKVVTNNGCKDVCIFSNLPIMAGLYDVKGKQGVYYEVIIRKMGGIIAIGNPTSPSICKSATSSLLTRLTR